MSKHKKNTKFITSAILKSALIGSVKKLNPVHMIKNPVMFVVEVGLLVTVLLVFMPDIFDDQGSNLRVYNILVAVILLLTILFANFAEAVAEGRGKAQANALRGTRGQTPAKRWENGDWKAVDAASLRKGDVIYVEAGDTIPSDGEILEGMATVDESAITGESAPVIRESGGDRSSVTGGTRILSDWLKVKVSVNPGETFLDRMISLVEGAKRGKTPNEIALTILLIGLTIIFLAVVVTLQPFALYAKTSLSLTTLVALLVCLIPTTIGGLLSATYRSSR